jgi:hypothetical protein
MVAHRCHLADSCAAEPKVSAMFSVVGMAAEAEQIKVLAMRSIVGMAAEVAHRGSCGACLCSYAFMHAARRNHLTDARLQIAISCASGAHVPSCTLRVGSADLTILSARAFVCESLKTWANGEGAPRLRRDRALLRLAAQPSPAGRVSAGGDDRWRGAGQGPGPGVGLFCFQTIAL